MGLTAGGVPVYYDSAGHLFENPSDAQINALNLQLAGKADASALTTVAGTIPKPASTAPMAEKTGAAIGQQAGRFALEDHQHPRLTSTTQAVVASGTTATVSFTRTFTNKPGVVCTEIEGDTAASAQPAIFKVQSWV